MRVAFAIILFLLIVAQVVCFIRARRSSKAIGKHVALLVISLIPPMTGNLIIISSSIRILSSIGYYIYFFGMNLVMYALLRFTMAYCSISKERRVYCRQAYILQIVDIIQLLCNPLFHHAFRTEPILVDGALYYRLLPYLGQTFHRVVDYGILGAVLVIFAVKMIRAPRVSAERYSVILLAMLITTAWETAYIFSRTPVDRAMVGFGVFGLLIYYLSLVYRPLRLLDSMLANMAWQMPVALYFFDAGGHCIWANKPAIDLLGLEADNYEPASAGLRKLFGDYDQDGLRQHRVTKDRQTKSYMVEKHVVTDERQRLMGSYLSVRDNTEEQETLQREIYRATHDILTGLYNRTGYDLLLPSLNLQTTYLLIIDLDNFKSINDTWGHEVGDKVLQRVAEALRTHFATEEYVCRVGGDEFVLFVTHPGEQPETSIADRVERINADLAEPTEGLPPLSVSVGAACGKDAASHTDLFERADHALYETKRRGKRGLTFYREERDQN